MVNPNQILVILFIAFLSFVSCKEKDREARLEKKGSKNQEVIIAASSDLKFVLDSLLKIYKTRNPKSDIKITYGSPSKFFDQIVGKAPFDLYFSSDPKHHSTLEERNLLSSEIIKIGFGKLVLWSKVLDPNTEKFNCLSNSLIKRISITNPAYSSYGVRAIESLKYYRIEENLQSKIIFGENEIQTAQYIVSERTEVGIIALSLAISETMKNSGGKYYLIPDESYQPIKISYVLLKKAQFNKQAIAFSEFLQANESIEIFEHYGIIR